MSEPDVATLPDDEVVRLCDTAMESEDQEELSGLLADSREDRLDGTGQVRPDDLMALYRRGLVLKARAWQEAVARGLRTASNDADHVA